MRPLLEIVARLLLSIGVAACATDAERTTSARGPAADAIGSDRPPAVARIPLVTTRDDGVADSQVVAVLLEGQDAWLALDTGAPFSFLFRASGEDERVEHAGTVLLGDESWDLPGYGDDAIGVELFRSRPIVGILGLDFFAELPALIDYPGGEIVRFLDGELPASCAAWPQVPLAGREHGRALVGVVLDGSELTLMLDTGAHDTFWFGVAGGEEDELSVVQTADGAQWDVFVGRGVLALPAEPPRSIPVMRALQIGYLSQEMAELDCDGLLGLTALGWRPIVLDFAAGALRLGPRND